MHDIQKKLNSSTGASILIALMYMLVALVVGTIVLTAANTGTSHIAAEKSSLQGQLAVESAVKLLAQDVCSGTFTGGYVCTESSDYYPAVYNDDGEETAPEIPASVPVPAYTKGAAGIREESGVPGSRILSGCENTLKAIYFNSTGHFTSESYTSFSELAFDSDLPDVTCELTVGDDYSVSAVLYLADDSSSDRVRVYFAPTVSEFHGGSSDTVLSESGGRDMFTTTVTTNYTTTVTWNAPSITKLTGGTGS